MQIFFLLLQPLLLPGKMPQHMQQQGVGYGHPMKSKGPDQHWIVRFSVELLEEVETLAPSCLLAGVCEFPQHDDVGLHILSHSLSSSLWASGCRGRKGGVSHYTAGLEVHMHMH